VSNRKKRDERASRAAQMRRERERAESRRTRLTVGAIVAAIVVIIVAAGAAIFASERDGGGETPHDMTSDFGIVYSANSSGSDQKVEGVKPVKLVFYEDFICPACKAFEDQVKSYVQDQVKRGAISVEYRPIAFLDDASTTDYSSRAANAAICVYDSEGAGAFHRFHDILYADQPSEGSAGLDDATLNRLAEETGADDVESCIDNQDFGGTVADATDAASQNNVVQTPTIFVGGQQLQAAEEGSVPTLQDLVNAVLAASAKTAPTPTAPPSETAPDSGEGQ
jgi:protein-disulfide isomerase